MFLDPKGARAVAGTIDGDLDLAGVAGLYPDRGIAGSRVPEQGTEDERWSHAGNYTSYAARLRKPSIMKTGAGRENGRRRAPSFDGLFGRFVMGDGIVPSVRSV